VLLENVKGGEGWETGRQCTCPESEEQGEEMMVSLRGWRRLVDVEALAVEDCREFCLQTNGTLHQYQTLNTRISGLRD
jgi:hypothetical protein